MTGLRSNIFKTKCICFVFLTLVFSACSAAYTDLNNLGAQIAKDVQQNLAPLKNLGPQIRQSVYRSLESVRALQPRSNAEDGIIGEPEPSLDNLGESIDQIVYASLAPVRALELMAKMRNGRGGTTVVEHLPGGRKFIVKNSETYECDSGKTQLTPSGECQGELTRFTPKEKKDFCYTFSKSQINNFVCLGTGSFSVIAINNNVECKPNPNSQVVVLTISEYKRLCDDVSNKVRYKYTADTKDIDHVEIPSKNKFVKCLNNESNVCIFEESASATQNSINIF